MKNCILYFRLISTCRIVFDDCTMSIETLNVCVRLCFPLVSAFYELKDTRLYDRGTRLGVIEQRAAWGDEIDILYKRWLKSVPLRRS